MSGYFTIPILSKCSKSTIIPCLFIQVKVVIFGNYINLNKITKIQRNSLKFNKFLVFVIHCSLQCKIKAHAV